MKQNLLNVSEATDRLGISTRTVRRLIDEGAMPVHRIRNSVRISEDDLARYMASCRRLE